MGPNGAGKSTIIRHLTGGASPGPVRPPVRPGSGIWDGRTWSARRRLRHLTGIYRPDSGEVLVEGSPVYESPEKKALIASIPDDWYAFPSATIADMMRFCRGFYPTFDMARYEKEGPSPGS